MCKCVRGEICCQDGCGLLRALEEEFRKAVLTGDWSGFDDTRDRWETHFGKVTTGTVKCDDDASTEGHGKHHTEDDSRR